MSRRSPIYQPTRRALLGSAAALGGAALLGRPARAGGISPVDRKFIFIFNIGGWDPTRVFSDGFDHTIVDMESSAERASAAGLSYITHPNRPQIDAFFSQYASRIAIIDGMLVPSIAHEACFQLVLTGGASDSASDWPSILGLAEKSRYTAPNLVLGGPSFPGPSREAVVQSGVGGQLADLLSGDYRSWSAESNGEVLSLPSRQVLDRYLRQRASAYLESAPEGRAFEQAAAFQNALSRASGLEADAREIDFSSIHNLGDATGVAVAALSSGISRCVMLCEPVSGERGFDSHTTNDDLQNVLFGDLFTYLQSLIFGLEAQDGEFGGSLLDETCVVVFSEMGRTPWLNTGGGKDHWPYTSVMLIGSGVRGGVNIGGYDADWIGETIDPETGDPDEDGEPITCQGLGATLLAMGGVDWTEHCPDSGPIPALTTDTI
ncbi:MAG: hypothetical protein ACI8RZ_002620 [Myxococcota bacterium]|jgi:uncharacterized protein (DUF1501 family)